MSETIHVFVYMAVALVLLTGAGNGACRFMFRVAGLSIPAQDTPGDEPKAGRIIGWLERLVLAAGILVGSWELFAAVIALKSVARFTKLDDRRFAEYFLVGSLFSVLWAVVVTTALLSYDRHLGSDILSDLDLSGGRTPSVQVPEALEPGT